MLSSVDQSENNLKDSFLAHGYAGPFPTLHSSAFKTLQSYVWNRHRSLLWVLRLLLEKANVLSPNPMDDREAHIHSAMVFNTAIDPDILENVSAILGPDLLIWMSQVICRWPGHGGVDWHVDKINANVEGVHVSIALSEMNRKNGCLQIIPGTHHYSVDLNALARQGECDLSDVDSMLRLADRIAPDNAPHEVLSIEVKPGEYFFTKGGLWHGVVGNRTLQTRMAFVTRFMRPEYADKTDHPCILVQGQDTHQRKPLHSAPTLSA